MNSTVFLTVLSGVVTYILGQLVLKLVIEPVQEMRRTIGVIAYSLIEHAGAIYNPGVLPEEQMKGIAEHFRKMASQLQSHLYLVPCYAATALIFRLPSRDKVRAASGAFHNLAHNVFHANASTYENNPKQVETIHDALGIFIAEESRWPKREG